MSVYYLANRISPQPGAFPSGFCEVDLTDYETYGLTAETTITTSSVDPSSEQGMLGDDGSMEKKYVDGTSVDVVELRG